MSESIKDKNNVIRTISISKEQDEFLKNHKGKINFSNECRALIDRMREKVNNPDSDD